MMLTVYLRVYAARISQQWQIHFIALEGGCPIPLVDDSFTLALHARQLNG